MSTEEKKQPTLEERLDAALKAAKAAKEENANLKGKVKDLTDELKVKEATAAPSAMPVVKVDGSHYQFVAPRFKHGHKEHYAKDAAKDEILCAELVAMGSGVIKKVQTK